MDDRTETDIVEIDVDEALAAEERAEAEEREADVPTDPEDPGLEELADPEADRRFEGSEEALLDPESDEVRTRADLVRVGDVLGVPFWYERGAAPTPASFWVARSFVPVLEATVRQVRRRVPSSYGALERISSAGLHVAKPGMHGEGRACDWDRLVFANVEISPIGRDHASSSAARRRRYWAFAAICRSNSCFVLHGEYDAAHGDHIHADNQTGVGFNRASSTVKLCQALLNDVYGERLRVDGDFGQNTDAAMRRALARLGLPNDLADVDVWRRFLRRSARLGFAAAP